MKILVLDSYDIEICRPRLAADSAWRPDRRPLFVPEGMARLDLSLHLALRICRQGKCIAPEFASRYYDAWAAAVLPHTGQAHTLVADDSIVLGPWQELHKLPLETQCEGHTVKFAHPGEALHTAIAALSRGMTFKTGDVLVLPPSLLATPKAAPSSFTVPVSETDKLIDFNIR